MAVADAVLPSPPPPPPPPSARTVAVRFALAPMLALGRVLCVAAGALACLCFATAWVTSAAAAARIVARRALGKASAPFLFLEALMYGAFKVYLYSFLVFLALAVLLACVTYVIALVSGSTSGFNKSASGPITRESVAGLFLRLAVFGFVADVAFFLLVVAGHLVAMMSPHVEGSISQGEMVGSVIEDVGTFGMHATACVMIPALFLSLWRAYQADRKAPSQFC
ncbi:uncharacterized protein [Aegilops tauschii subsp. strangulata]|uniref:uncharacterized protein isoform X1 n=1 Tax=Aegilops tauschii subsp. strangulata TaxID=200361 RepID=UPI00098BB9EB|nr:uncharacterized protein LOC109739408 isoform X1 [Aegilops tauschii subsp. strangulata]